jgi:hypothetical protein
MKLNFKKKQVKVTIELPDNLLKFLLPFVCGESLILELAKFYLA